MTWTIHQTKWAMFLRPWRLVWNSDSSCSWQPAAAQGSHWYPKKSGAFFGHVPKKKYGVLSISVFCRKQRFKNNRGRPIFSDHLVVKSICFSWLDPHVGCLANEITGTHRDYTWDTWGYNVTCTSKKLSKHVVFDSRFSSWPKKNIDFGVIPVISSLGMGGSFRSGTKESGLNWESPPPQRPDWMRGWWGQVCW